MKTRFDKAVMKLYTAFHEGTLDSGDCAHCAVGNIVGSRNWADVINCGHGLMTINQKYFDKILLREQKEDINRFNKGLQEIEKTDYTPFELMNVEAIFMTIVVESSNKNLQFKGLCEVVKYLAELDGVENPMEIMHLFKNKELVL